MHSLVPVRPMDRTCEKSYQTFQLDRIFVQFSKVETDLPRKETNVQRLNSICSLCENEMDLVRFKVN